MNATQPKRKGNPNAKDPKGRWYVTFGGPKEYDSKTIEREAEKIADNIEKHLFDQARCLYIKFDNIECNQRRPRASENTKRKGCIEYRNRAIEQNVSKICPDHPVEIDDRIAKKYFFLVSDEDVACVIKHAIKYKQQKQQKQRNKDFPFVWESPYITAVKICRDFKRKIPEGDVKLLAFHQHVKDLYKYLLQGKKAKFIEHRIPRNEGALLQLLKARTQNKNINALIRLGKIIHYETMWGEKTENTQFHEYKDKIGKSRFWSSKKQTIIKQNEAFVRVWRSAIAFAARNLKDWIDPNNTIKGDILLSKEQVQNQFSIAAFDRKSVLLFGNHSELIKLNEGQKKSLVLFCLNKLADLRHASFHFKKIEIFTKALLKSTSSPKSDEKGSFPLSTLYEEDRERLRQRTIEIIKSVKAPQFLQTSELRKLCEELLACNTSLLPLPRIARVLQRVKDGWQRSELRLPPYYTSQEREKNPWLNCQYGLLKLLYEGFFGDWLEQFDLSSCIQKALAHTTAQAQEINKKDLYLELIAAKATHVLRQGTKDSQDFFFQLSAATATEMRVQNGYQSNADAAQEQSEYIEKFKHDVIALAFEDYLKKKNLDFLLKENLNEQDASKIKENNSHLEEYLRNVKAPKCLDAWCNELYILLHLLPVETVGDLRQQLKKWQIVTGKAGSFAVEIRDQKVLSQNASCEGQRQNDAEQDNLVLLLSVFDMYLAMHDAQFVGQEVPSFRDSNPSTHPTGQPDDGMDQLKPFYKDSTDFDEIFRDNEAQYKPKRGLREMLRFGQKCVYKLYEQHPIESATVKQWIKRDETALSEAQEHLRNSHGNWVKTKGREKEAYKNENLESYKDSLKRVEAHRHNTAQVLLQDHLQIHRFVLRLVGRLIDYAGLWERDLYFVWSALNYYGCNSSSQENQDSKSSEHKEALKSIKKGQIVEAFAHLPESSIITQSLERYFALTWTPELLEEKPNKNSSYEQKHEELQKRNESLKTTNPCIWIRNRFAHLNLLDETPLCLLNEFQHARQLMAYDRKLKNSVTKAFKALFEKEGIHLSFTMDNSAHQLNVESLEVKTLNHLGDKRIKESSHSDFFVQILKEAVDPKKTWENKKNA